MKQIITKPKDDGTKEGSIYLKMNKVISTSNEFPVNSKAAGGEQPKKKKGLLRTVDDEISDNPAIPYMSSYTKPIQVNKHLFTNAKNEVDKFKNTKGWEK
jgi:hypothetical protein